jgi:hypothetical protein
MEAIASINEYLYDFINDTEAWAELGELYVREMDFVRATFCFEEVLLAFVSILF